LLGYSFLFYVMDYVFGETIFLGYGMFFHSCFFAFPVMGNVTIVFM
jgi:hypothetical protein